MNGQDLLWTGTLKTVGKSNGAKMTEISKSPLRTIINARP